MYNESIFIEKSDGTRSGPFATKVGKDSATIFNSSIDVTEGDKLIRPLPTGKEESYIITSSHSSSGPHHIPPHFVFKLRKTTALPEMTSPKHTTININNSTGIQVGDHNVLNIGNAINELIQKIESSDADFKDKVEAKSRLAAFLSHPLVGSILGGVAGSLPGML